MKKVITICLVGFITSLLFLGCSKSNNAVTGTSGGGTKTFSCSGITSKFSTDVQPILTSICSTNSSCHASGSTNSGGPFTSFAEVNARKSNIRAAILAGTMPQTGTISQPQINAFICWIDSGAPNN
ncbi:MAG: hypothetical protein WCG67_09320 [Ferruginibacter sp.]